MAVPKSKISKSRRGMRRSHLRRQAQGAVPSKCSQCGGAKLPHRVCPTCGTYKGQEIIQTEDI